MMYHVNGEYYNDHGIHHNGGVNFDGQSRFSSLDIFPQQELQVLDVAAIRAATERNEKIIGLELNVTPSFLNSFDKLCARDEKKSITFSARSLQIGSWKRTAQHNDSLITKCYFKSKLLALEVLEGNKKNKLAINWSDISAMRATFHVNEPEVLEIVVINPPTFFRETNTLPRKHSRWAATPDFTEGQASLGRKYILEFEEGVLEKNYGMLLQDDILYSLSRQPFPHQANMYFNEMSFANDIRFARPPIVAQQPFAIRVEDSESPISVMDHPIRNMGSNANYPKQVSFTNENATIPRLFHQEPNVDHHRHQYRMRDQSDIAVSSLPATSTSNQFVGFRPPCVDDLGLDFQQHQMISSYAGPGLQCAGAECFSQW